MLCSPVDVRLQFSEKGLSMFSAWCFPETKGKLYREISAKKINAKAQQIAVELAPAANLEC